MSKRTENCIAISAVFHRDKRYQKFYDTFGESLGGFVGIWDYIGNMAKEFTVQEHPKCWNSHEWTDAVDNFVDILYEASYPLSPTEAREAARIAIGNS